MKIEGIIWLETIIEKLAVKHSVQTEEIESLLENEEEPPKFRFAQKGEHPGDDVYQALGQTEAGRHLAVLFIYKASTEALVLSAHDMTDKERKQYGRK